MHSRCFFSFVLVFFCCLNSAFSYWPLAIVGIKRRCSYFDPLIPTVITADASGFGLGGALLQFNDNRWTPVAYTSRTMTIAEKRYAQIEKELLAAVWCCEHFRQYLYGAPQFVVQTDHKPLVPLINSRDLDKVPIRC